MYQTQRLAMEVRTDSLGTALELIRGSISPVTFFVNALFRATLEKPYVI